MESSQIGTQTFNNQTKIFIWGRQKDSIHPIPAPASFDIFGTLNLFSTSPKKEEVCYLRVIVDLRTNDFSCQNLSFFVSKFFSTPCPETYVPLLPRFLSLLYPIYRLSFRLISSLTSLSYDQKVSKMRETIFRCFRTGSMNLIHIFKEFTIRILKFFKLPPMNAINFLIKIFA